MHEVNVCSEIFTLKCRFEVKYSGYKVMQRLRDVVTIIYLTSEGSDLHFSVNITLSTFMHIIRELSTA